MVIKILSMLLLAILVVLRWLSGLEFLPPLHTVMLLTSGPKLSYFFVCGNNDWAVLQESTFYNQMLNLTSPHKGYQLGGGTAFMLQARVEDLCSSLFLIYMYYYLFINGKHMPGGMLLHSVVAHTPGGPYWAHFHSATMSIPNPSQLN